jgi:mannose-6-phosphate isomerase-like protein (cupin superfamily)
MAKNMPSPHRIDSFAWRGDGFHPFVSHRNWLVALMNWEPRFDSAHVGQIERHNQTDEVFVLTHGRGLLYVDNDLTIQAIDMLPGLIYNVTRGTWHSVIGTRESSWLIVESNDTNEQNTDYRQLTEVEIAELKKQYPAWILDIPKT